MGELAKTVAVKARITELQAERLYALADDRFGGNVSAALRQMLADAELLRIARDDFRRLAVECELRLPRDEPGGLSTPLEVILSGYAVQEVE